MHCFQFVTVRIYLIMDKLPSAIGLQLVYRCSYPRSKSDMRAKGLIEAAKETDLVSVIQSHLIPITRKWIAYQEPIGMITSIKCPRCGKLLDVSRCLTFNKVFLICDNNNCKQSLLLYCDIIIHFS